MQFSVDPVPPDVVMLGFVTGGAVGAPVTAKANVPLPPTVFFTIWSVGYCLTFHSSNPPSDS